MVQLAELIDTFLLLGQEPKCQICTLSLTKLLLTVDELYIYIIFDQE